MTSNPDVPPFTGYVETTVNALRLIHAARQGVIPRITRRLNDSERRTMITSGAVFIFSVDESGIKRWTDGLLWSPSRIVGNFLVYREINERTSSRGSQRKLPYPGDSPSRGFSSYRGSPDHLQNAFKSASQALHGPSDQGTFKADGLIKKTITVTIDGSDLHLISYYTSEDIRSGKLKRPTHRPDIMSLYMPPQIFRSTNFRVPPKVEDGPDGKSRLVCDSDDAEPAVGCKVEEQPYRVSNSPQWSSSNADSSPIEGDFASNIYHQGNNVVSSTHSYGRDSTASRWPVALDNLRISSLSRHDLSWSQSSSPTLSRDDGSRRRDSTQSPHTSPWPNLHSQSNRWRSDSYDLTSGSSGGHCVERPRLRSNTSYEHSGGTPHRREAERVPGYQHRISADLGGNREGAPQRLPWVPNRDAPIADKYLRSSRPEASFSPPPTLPFSPHHTYSRVGQSYGTTWATNETGVSDSTLHHIPVHNHHLHSYDTSASYTSSSPEDYSVDDYGNSS
ncbi:Gti1/Pac2 family-domain-containing protein [Collybia nuda]|uniref:Gti1/Pac2 family-domain-containing protein n=1 Tax=Collybia nuda TaxID=64659 RepID=A0A9P6CC74_9AGAR|nr:Gti1/Pac2 family-domain-containing protein [Collybia nuda]